MEQDKKVKRKQCVYDEAFGREAVALMPSSDESLTQIAAKLGVSHWNLRDWRKQYGAASGSQRPGKAAAARTSSESWRGNWRALRRENESLKAQRDIF